MGTNTYQLNRNLTVCSTAGSGWQQRKHQSSLYFELSCFNSLGHGDTIWRWRSWSTVAQVMACCLTAPSHYLNQCWLIISKVLWHSSEDIIIRRFEDTNQQSMIKNYIFKITLRGQWVNQLYWSTLGGILQETLLMEWEMESLYSV